MTSSRTSGSEPRSAGNRPEKRSSSRLRVVALAGVTALGAAVAAIWYGATAVGPAGSPERGSVAVAPGGDGPCAFAPGTSMAYEVTTRTRTEIDMAPLMSQVRVDAAPLTAEATAMDQRGSRSWRVDLEGVARGADGSAVLAARIEAGPTEIDGQGPVPPSASLSETFLVRVNARCNIRDFAWRSDADPAATRDQQRLMSGLGYLAPQGDERSYGGGLFDVIGRFYASFSVADDGALSGRAVMYREPFGRSHGSVRPAFEVVGSAIDVERRSGQWFASLRRTRDLTLTMHDEAIGRLRGSVTARSVAPAGWRASVDLDDGGWTWGLMLAEGAAPATVAAAEPGAQSQLGGVAVDDAVDRYLEQIRERGSSIDAIPYLVDWLQANPEGAGQLVAALRSGQFDGEQRGAAGLFLALSIANTEQSRAALLGILDDPGYHGGHKISAAQALANIEAPTEAMVDAIAALIDDPELDEMTRGALAMSLGTFANHNLERAPELAEVARERLQAELRDAGGDPRLGASLLAAGNAGHDDLAPAIEPYLDHEDPEMRQRAAHALRHMSPDTAYPRLSAVMTDDDGAVRAIAIETATAVSRAHGAAPPAAVVEHAVSRLDLTTAKREQKALLDLLGQAASHGDDHADAALRQHFEEELTASDRDLGKLQALGRHTNTRWTAK